MIPTPTMAQLQLGITNRSASLESMITVKANLSIDQCFATSASSECSILPEWMTCHSWLPFRFSLLYQGRGATKRLQNGKTWSRSGCFQDAMRATNNDDNTPTFSKYLERGVCLAMLWRSWRSC